MTYNAKSAVALAGVPALEESLVAVVAENIMAGAGAVKAKSHADAISIFNGAVDTKVQGDTTWQEAVEAIRDGSFAPNVSRLRSITDVKAKDRYKKTFPAVCFCGTFRGSRANANIEVPTGFIIPDIDHVEDVDGIFDRLKADPYTWFAFRSPSGDGIKCGFRAEGIKTDANIKAFFASVSDYFLKAYGIEIDGKCKDISRLTFMSHDPEAYVAQSPEWFPVGCEKTETEQAAKPDFKFDGGIGHERYAMKVLENCCQKISRSLPGEQHGVRLDMAVLAGGYAHYMSDSTVYSALEAAVVASGAADLTAAMATVKDGLAYGKARPVTIPDKETPKLSAGVEKAANREPKKSCFAGATWEDCTAGNLRSGELPDLDWTFPGFQLTHNVSLLIGLPGTGKSFFANQLGAYVASGCGCDGIFEPGGVQGKVLVLAGEEDERIVPRRVRSLGNALFAANPIWSDFNRDSNEIKFNSNLIVKSLAGESLRLLDREGQGSPYRTQVYDDLLEFCKTIPNLQLIIVDPLSRFMGLSENDNNDGTEFITALESLAIAVGASIVAVHHVGKGGKTWLDSLVAYAARGASGLVGAVRGQMNIVALTKKEARAAIDPPGNPKDGEYLALAFPKISYGPGRPYVFLRRGPGGTLTAVDPAQKTQDDVQVEAAILKWIKAQIHKQEAGGLPALTVNSVGELTQEWKKILGATKTKVREVANAAILTGDLVLETAKNTRGKVVEYLRLSPEAAAEMAARIPARNTSQEIPATPANTSREKLAGI